MPPSGLFQALRRRPSSLQRSGAILATRRRRGPDEPELWAAHLAVVEGEAIGEVEFETDRARLGAAVAVAMASPSSAVVAALA